MGRRDAYIIDAVRTPIGRLGGALAKVRPDDLAALVIRALVERTGVDPASIEDVIFGCANQAGEDNRNPKCGYRRHTRGQFRTAPPATRRYSRRFRP